MEQVFSGVASKPITVDKAHRLLTHFGEADTRTTCKHLDIPLQRGPLKPCLACGLGNARQKNLSKTKDTI